VLGFVRDRAGRDRRAIQSDKEVISARWNEIVRAFESPCVYNRCRMANAENACILMFSGGRDSTIAAVRLGERFQNLILATVTSEHLVGHEKVHARLRELRPHVPLNTTFIRMAQPDTISADMLSEATCLPCHRAYVAVGTTLAQRRGISNLAFGYVAYQNGWPEQTPYATSRLRELLRSVGISLHLPVEDLVSKEHAIAELVALRMSPDALEQKCLKQEFNSELPAESLKKEIDKWEQSTRNQLASSQQLTLTVLSEMRLDELS